MNEDVLDSLLSNLQLAQMQVQVCKDTLIADTDGVADVHQLDAALMFIQTALDDVQDLLEA